MSKFTALCEKVETFLKEQGEMPQPDPNAAVPPGQPVDQNLNLTSPEDEQNSEIQEVDNTTLERLIQTLVNFYQDKEQTLSAESIDRISKLPTSINKNNSEETVMTLMDIFKTASMPNSSSI
jgi:hypothetical protein